MNADDHAHVDLFARLDDHRAAVFQVEHGVGNGFTGLVGQQNAVGTTSDFTLVRLIVVEQAVHDCRAARVGQQFRLIADQTAGRSQELQANAVAARRTQLGHFCLAFRHLLNDDAGMLFINVDDDFFDRLHGLAGRFVLVHDDARTRYGELEAFAAHGFDQNGELKFATAGHVERILAFGFFDLQSDVAFGFLEQTVTDDAAGYLVAFGAGKRAVVDDEGHGDGRRVDRLGLHRFVDGRVTERVGDGTLGETGDGDDVTGNRFFDRLTLDAAECEDLGDTAGFNRLAVLGQNLDGLVRLDRAGSNAAGDDTAEEGVGFEKRTDHTERTFFDLRLRHVLQHEVEQRCKAFILRAFRVDVHPAIATRTVEDREVELFVGGVEVCEQVENFVDDFFVAAVRTVDLVDRDDRLQADLEGLADDELGLRHRAFGAIDENDRAVHHRENTFDFAAEVGVAGSVDDVDANALPFNRGRLGENGDAAFLFEIVRVHDAFCDALVLAERARLFQEFVNEGRFPMVNVRDDRDVAKCHIDCL